MPRHPRAANAQAKASQRFPEWTSLTLAPAAQKKPMTAATCHRQKSLYMVRAA